MTAPVSSSFHLFSQMLQLYYLYKPKGIITGLHMYIETGSLSKAASQYQVLELQWSTHRWQQRSLLLNRRDSLLFFSILFFYETNKKCKKKIKANFRLDCPFKYTSIIEVYVYTTNAYLVTCDDVEYTHNICSGYRSPKWTFYLL